MMLQMLGLLAGGRRGERRECSNSANFVENSPVVNQHHLYLRVVPNATLFLFRGLAPIRSTGIKCLAPRS
jgi:hypothetical protein